MGNGNGSIDVGFIRGQENYRVTELMFPHYSFRVGRGRPKIIQSIRSALVGTL